MTAPVTPLSGVAFFVAGIPAPQGSKRAFVRGNRAIVVESSTKVRPWRDAVRHEAADAMNGAVPCDGAVQVLVTFYLPKPASTRRILPTVRPDVDKLLRSTLDGLKDGGVYTDDARVVGSSVTKVYGARPGAAVTVRFLTPEQQQALAPELGEAL